MHHLEYKMSCPPSEEIIGTGEVDVEIDEGESQEIVMGNQERVLNSVVNDVEAQELVDSGTQVRVEIWDPNYDKGPISIHTWDHS